MTQSKSCSRSALPDRRSETPAHRFVAGVCLHCSLTSECKSPADKCPAALKLAVHASGPLSSKSFASEIWTCLANRCVSTFGGGGLRSLKIGVLGGDRQGRLGSRSWVCSTPKELHEAVFSMSEARLLAWFVGGGGNQPIAQNPVQIESLEGHTRT